jgi:DNA polymerase-1
MEQFSLFDKGPDEKPVLQKPQSARPPARKPDTAGPDGQPLTELSFDVEATGSNPLIDTVVGISLCREKGKAFYVPVRHTQGPNVPDAPALLKKILEDASIAKIGHNLKYDILILRQEGIHVQGQLLDTMVAAYLLDPNKPGHSLEDTGLQYLMHRKRSFTEVLGKRLSFADVPPDEATQYAAEDAELAMELKDILFSKLKGEGLEELYLEMEMPLITLLADMEERGIRIDTRRLEGLSKELQGELALLQDKIYLLAGGPFNINSPKQLCKVLFVDLGLKPRRKTKTGFSTGVDVLEDLAKVHELPGEVLNYRTLYKLKTTYADTLPAVINPKTGRLHTSFNQTVTATGRLSSSEPNLQNIPVRGEWGRRIREAFIADEGHVLLSADYSQVELRILAHMSADEGLAEAFRNGIDIHTRTAAELFAVPEENVGPDMRRIAKVVNFGVVYGMSAYGLSESLSISPREAGAYIDSYFERHGGVRDYMKATIEKAREQGYVTTLLGRKRPVPDILSVNAAIRQQAERLAINTPIQGTAADLIKIAMLHVARALRQEGLRARMLLQIHDELLFEIPVDEVQMTRETVRREMENALSLSIPLRVDIGWGGNWAEAH